MLKEGRSLRTFLRVNFAKGDVNKDRRHRNVFAFLIEQRDVAVSFSQTRQRKAVPADEIIGCDGIFVFDRNEQQIHFRHSDFHRSRFVPDGIQSCQSRARVKIEFYSF